MHILWFSAAPQPNQFGKQYIDKSKQQEWTDERMLIAQSLVDWSSLLIVLEISFCNSVMFTHCTEK
jgi:hypothetical protein